MNKIIDLFISRIKLKIFKKKLNLKQNLKNLLKLFNFIIELK